MDKNEETLIKVATQVEILVSDFQRFRDQQELRWKEQREHVEAENKFLEGLRFQLKWHAVIGGFAISTLAYHLLRGIV